MSYRNPKLLEAARELPCALCGRQDGTVCAAHSNQLRDGKGRSLKAHDYRIAALCNTCHTAIDSGKAYTKEERRDLWEEAHRWSIGQMFERGLLQVKP